MLEWWGDGTVDWWNRRGGATLKGLETPAVSDTFVSMGTISKRELVRNPALASHLKPGESMQLEDGKEPLVILRRKKRKLTVGQIHADLERIWGDAPAVGCQAVLDDLRK